MSLRVKSKERPQIPPLAGGTYPAICVGIVDLGEQYNQLFKKYESKVLIVWEIPSQTVEVDGEEKPRWLSRDYTASLNAKSKLAEVITGWRGEPITEQERRDGMNLSAFLGRSCLLQVIIEQKEDRQFNRVSAVMGMPVGMPSVTTESELFLFDMDDWDEAVLEKLPDWMVERVKRSTEYQKRHTPDTVVDFDTVVPTEEKAETQEDCPI